MRQNIFKKSSPPELDPETASAMLEAIFEECNKKPNTIPLEVLESYSNYRRERYSAQKVLLVLVLLLFLMVPLLFLSPNFTVTQNSSTASGQPVYNLQIDTLLPVSHVTATIDGRNMAIYETGNCCYTIEPTLNGTMSVTVTIANKQYMTQTIEVDQVDLHSPVLLSSERTGKKICLYLSDEVSGIDYDAIYGVGLSGTRYEISSYDSQTGCVRFDMPSESVNIFVPDHAGNQLQLVLTVNP